MPQYHYTDRLTVQDILRAKCIEAHELTLYRDMIVRPDSRTLKTPPLVWLSTDPIIESTVEMKLISAGWPADMTGNLWRFVFPDEYSQMGLAEYSEAHQIDFEWWRWVVISGDLVGSSYTMWRCHPRDIAAADWIGLEVLSGYRDDGTPVWKPKGNFK